MRELKRIFVIALLLNLGLPFVCSAGQFGIENFVAKLTRSMAIHRLGRANSVTALRHAAGDNGQVYIYPDKSWIACWCDSISGEHSSDFHWSDAIVLSSDGKWFENPSGINWFKQVSRLDPQFNKWISDPAAPPEVVMSLKFEHLQYLLTTASSLAVARETLLRNGYIRIYPQISNKANRVVVKDSDITAPQPKPTTQQKTP